MRWPAAALVALLHLPCAQPQPTAFCATNGTPCPPPPWPPTYSLAASSMVNPNGPTAFLPPPSQRWGLASLDWNVASQVWNASGARVATIEAVSRAGCRALLAQGSARLCFIYHNLELALEALESNRAAMYPSEPLFNPALFLRFPNGSIYNEPGGPGDQYFWNHTEPSTRAFFVQAVMGSLAYPEVHGTYLDDVEGLPSEHFAMVAALNLSAADIAAHQLGASQTAAALLEAAIAAGKYIWQAFDGDDAHGRDCALPGPTPATCLAWMRARCTPAYQAHPVLQQAEPQALPLPPALLNASLASFLVTRGPHAFWGFGWDGRSRDEVDWLPTFNLDVGEPLGACAESAPGVFTRPWTHGQAALDCNTFVGTVPAQ